MYLKTDCLGHHEIVDGDIDDLQHFAVMHRARVGGWSFFHSFNINDAKQHMIKYAAAYNDNNQKALDVEQSWLHDHDWHVSPQISNGITSSWNLYNEYDTNKKSDFNFPNPAPTANSGSKITTKPYK
jgi:hypothetical protein